MLLKFWLIHTLALCAIPTVEFSRTISDGSIGENFHVQALDKRCFPKWNSPEFQDEKEYSFSGYCFAQRTAIDDSLPHHRSFIVPASRSSERILERSFKTHKNKTFRSISRVCLATASRGRLTQESGCLPKDKRCFEMVDSFSGIRQPRQTFPE